MQDFEYLVYLFVPVFEPTQRNKILLVLFDSFFFCIEISKLKVLKGHAMHLNSSFIFIFFTINIQENIDLIAFLYININKLVFWRRDSLNRGY